MLASLIAPPVQAQGIQQVGQTSIAKWQNGKKAALSLTYDGNTINQFRVALPIMNRLGFKGTFFVVTPTVPGSSYQPKFIGRPVDEIVAETATVPTNRENFFERASAVRFLGYENAYNYHIRAGTKFEQGHITEAYNLIDEAYRKLREGDFIPSDERVEPRNELYLEILYGDPEFNLITPDVDLVTWDQLKKYQTQGHEFGSHTISHPYLSVMDSVNLMYELEMSKAELRHHLGPEAEFSAELPFGTEDERVMDYALDIYPALRNRMPAPYLEELARWSDADPANSGKEYVQWQRGPKSDTPMKQMKSWIDTALKGDNIWLVLVFHGIEGIGWEPLTREELEEYFTYIKNKEDNIWVATFGDVTKYMRERMQADIDAQKKGDTIEVTLTHSLDKTLYDLPLTLKTYIPDSWKSVKIQQGADEQTVQSHNDQHGTFVLYQAVPNKEIVTLTAF